MAYKDPHDPRLLKARRDYYHRNKQSHIERNKKSKEKCKEIIRKAKEAPCADCNECYPYYVMDFHHLDKDSKVNDVARLISHGPNKVLEEIKKCVVLCSNCHRIRTHEENLGSLV